HSLVPHRYTVSHGDRAELAWRATRGGDAFLHCLGLPHQGDVAGCSFIPAGCNADERLMDLLARQTHGIIVGAMGRAIRPFRHVTAWQLGLDVGLRIHRGLPATVGYLTELDFIKRYGQKAAVMALLQKCSGMLPVGHSEQSRGSHDVDSQPELAGN